MQCRIDKRVIELLNEDGVSILGNSSEPLMSVVEMNETLIL